MNHLYRYTSNIVFNELDWLISNQWESFEAEKPYKTKLGRMRKSLTYGVKWGKAGDNFKGLPITITSLFKNRAVFWNK